MIEIIQIPKGADKDSAHHLVLQNLILNYRSRRIVEIGVYKGKTMRRIMRTAHIASEIDQWFAVDPWQANAELYPGHGGPETWDRLYRGVCKYMPWFPALRVIRMRSIEAAGLFLQESMDFVYIDGDHSADAVEADIRAWVSKVKKGGIIGGHDFVEDKRVTDTYNVAAGVRRVFGDAFEKAKCSVWYKVVG